MAGLIKSQILKHLSKFTKNLSPDSIHLSTLKGEGELYNLELDEVALTDILDLPTWLIITKGVCNRVAVKIQWTKLKSQPICVFLDEVEVDMETCEDLRKPMVHPNSQSINGKYGFAERIIDGMYVSINSVIVNFKAKAFRASIQLSRIIVQSKTPTWENAFDLRLTRIKEEVRGEVLIFKEAEWQTLRIEANALEGSAFITTPLRLIANQSKARITIKKRLQDCVIVSSRLLVHLDDLLWVLTDSQIKAALSFISSLEGIIQKSSQQSKLLASEKIKKQGFSTLSQASPTGLQQQQSRVTTKSQKGVTKVFEKYDITETSYHLHSGRIDLHICDESFDNRSLPRKVEGGAIQMTFLKMWFDFYPYHVAGSHRALWMKYDENMAVRDIWAEELLQTFYKSLGKVKIEQIVPQKDNTFVSAGEMPNFCHQDKLPNEENIVDSLNLHIEKEKNYQKYQNGKFPLLENAFVFRLNDIVVYEVSSAKDSRNLTSPKTLLCSDKKTLWLPPEMSSIHMEHTDYYLPESMDFPVPSSNTFVVLNPLKLTVDNLSILWLNVLYWSIIDSLDISSKKGLQFHTDIRMDALMPRVVFPLNNANEEKVDGPTALQLQMSRGTITNCEKSCFQQKLKFVLEEYNKAKLFKTTSFPKPQDSLQCLPCCMIDYVKSSENSEENVHFFNKESIFNEKDMECYTINLNGKEFVITDNSISDTECEKSHNFVTFKESAKFLENEKKFFKMDKKNDTWTVSIEQFWMEFLELTCDSGRPVPFLDCIPVNCWLFRPKISDEHSTVNIDNNMDISEKSILDEDSFAEVGEEITREDSSKCADFHIVVKLGEKISLQLDHFQFLFLMRLTEYITQLKNELDIDTAKVSSSQPHVPQSATITAIIQEVQIIILKKEIRNETNNDDQSVGSSSELTEEILLPINKYESKIQEVLHEDNRNDNNLETHSVEVSVTEESAKYESNMEELEIDLNYKNSLESTNTSDEVMSNDLLDSPQIHISESITEDSNLTREVKTDVFKRSFSSGFSSLSKGIINLKSSLTDKVKESMKKDQLEIGPLDDWEAMSMLSSDDEDYLFLKFATKTEIPAFEKQYRISYDTDSEDESELITDGKNIKNTVVAVTFTLSRVEAFFQLKDEDVTVSANICDIWPRYIGNVNPKQIQEISTETVKEVLIDDEYEVPVKLQFKLAPAKSITATSGNQGVLHIKVDHLKMTTLPLPCITALVELVEDEQNSPVLPLLIDISDTYLTLHDTNLDTDQVTNQSCYSSSEKKAPINLHVANLLIRRYDDAVFHFAGFDSITEGDFLPHVCKRPPLENNLDVQHQTTSTINTLFAVDENDERSEKTEVSLQYENEKLRRQLEKIGKLNSASGVVDASSLEILQRECEYLRKKSQDAEKLKMENQNLIEEVSRLSSDVCILQEERESLLSSIQMLQEELEESENLRVKYRANLKGIH